MNAQDTSERDVRPVGSAAVSKAQVRGCGGWAPLIEGGPHGLGQQGPGGEEPCKDQGTGMQTRGREERRVQQEGDATARDPQCLAERVLREFQIQRLNLGVTRIARATVTHAVRWTPKSGGDWAKLPEAEAIASACPQEDRAVGGGGAWFWRQTGLCSRPHSVSFRP